MLHKGLQIYGKFCIKFKCDIHTNIIERMITRNKYTDDSSTRLEKVGMFTYHEKIINKKIKDKEITDIYYKTFDICKYIYIDIKLENGIIIPYHEDFLKPESDTRKDIDFILGVARQKNTCERLEIFGCFGYKYILLRGLNVDYNVLNDDTIIF